jgi:hypothetical protein
MKDDNSNAQAQNTYLGNMRKQLPLHILWPLMAHQKHLPRPPHAERLREAKILRECFVINAVNRKSANFKLWIVG